jgi:hypothetical protein
MPKRMRKMQSQPYDSPRAKRVIAEGGFDDVQKEVFMEAEATPPEKPKFPKELFMLWLMIDIIDILAEIGWVTVAVPIVWRIIKIVAYIWLFLWAIGKAGFGQRKILKSVLNSKQVRTAVTMRIVAVFAIEMIPVIAVIPTNVIFILLTHNRNKKIVQKFWELLEILDKELSAHNNQVAQHQSSKAKRVKPPKLPSE